MWFKLCNLPVQMATAGRHHWVRGSISVYPGESIDLNLNVKFKWGAVHVMPIPLGRNSQLLADCESGPDRVRVRVLSCGGVCFLCVLEGSVFNFSSQIRGFQFNQVSLHRLGRLAGFRRK